MPLLVQRHLLHNEASNIQHTRRATQEPHSSCRLTDRAAATRHPEAAKSVPLYPASPRSQTEAPAQPHPSGTVCFFRSGQRFRVRMPCLRMPQIYGIMVGYSSFVISALVVFCGIIIFSNLSWRRPASMTTSSILRHY